MGIWADRTWLASQGWRTDLRIQLPRNGTDERQVGLWAKTWRWGGRIAEVCLHAHGRIDIDWPDAGDTLDAIAATLREACARARAEFIDEVPCQTMIEHVVPGAAPRITLAGSSWETENMLKGKEAPFTPDIIDFMVDGPEDGSYLRGVLEGLRAGGPGLDYVDDLNPWAERRMLRDDQPAKWQFMVRPLIRRVGDLKVHAESYRHGEICTRRIDEALAGALAQTACAHHLQSFINYAPGGRLHGVTENGLPPGINPWKPATPDAALAPDPS